MSRTSPTRRRRLTIAMAAWLAVLPALAIDAPAAAAPAPAPATKARPKKPAKKPDAPAPADTDADKPTDPPAAVAPAAATDGGGGGNTASSAGGGGADAAFKPADAEPAKPPKQSDTPDVDSLRQEYLSLRDELFKSRARANAVASQLYSTRIQIKLTYTTARFYNPAKASIRLDGASVYEDASGAIGGDDGIRFDGYIAPGRHLLTFRVEATGKDDDTFSSTTESQIVVKAVAGKDLLVAAKARDSGDIAYAWKKTEVGSYGLGIDVAVATGKAVEAVGAKK